MAVVRWAVNVGAWAPDAHVRCGHAYDDMASGNARIAGLHARHELRDC